jgi:hypothetical protein
MNERPEAEAKLERLLDRTLRDLPLRRAPATLESRVLGELERRAALPWWRHNFARWPGGARAAFVSICAGLIGLALFGGVWATAGLRLLNESGALSMPWVRQAVAITDVAAELIALLVRAVPPAWLYDGLAVSALLYAVLFGLGVAAYRTLYVDSGIAGDIKP